tara:strand:- start:500 stop:706 length:207 start_codon:yes stop_codon:yes gene_type:complete
MSLTDDENFKVIFLPEPSGDISTLVKNSVLPIGVAQKIRALDITLQQHRDAISLLTKTLMEIKTQLSK